MDSEPQSSRCSDVWDEYAVRCPCCHAEAAASMVLIGTTGTYQEAFAKLGASRITCQNCGLAQDVPLGERTRYVYWYATEFDGHRLWARNRKHLNFLIQWLSGDVESRPETVATRAYLNALPKWLKSGKNRTRLLARLQTLCDDPSNR